MQSKLIDDVIKNLVLANADEDIQSIAAVIVNRKGEPELHLGMPQEQAYKIIAGLEILKYNIIKQILEDAGKPLRDRE